MLGLNSPQYPPPWMTPAVESWIVWIYNYSLSYQTCPEEFNIFKKWAIPKSPSVCIGKCLKLPNDWMIWGTMGYPMVWKPQCIENPPWSLAYFGITLKPLF